MKRRFRLPEELALPRVLDGPAALVLFAATAAILALMPLSFSISAFAARFFLTVSTLAVVLAAVWVALQAFQSRIAWSWFFAPVLGNLVLASAAMLVVRALAVLLQAATNLAVVTHVAFSLTPLVVLVTFAWTVEKNAQLPERPASILGWVSVALLAAGLFAVDFLLPLLG